MRDCYKYAVENGQLHSYISQHIEEWYFWTMREAILHIEVDEHLSSCCLITHESPVNSIMENLDMKSAELKKFDELPKELIRSCVLRRILHKKWLYRQSTMSAYIKETVELYSRETTECLESLVTYLYKRNPLTGLERNLESPRFSLSLVEKWTRFDYSCMCGINDELLSVICSCIKLDEERRRQKIENFCGGVFNNFESYLQNGVGSLYTCAHKEVTRQKQKMENSVEDSEIEKDELEANLKLHMKCRPENLDAENLDYPNKEVKGTFNDAEWIHSEIQMVIEQYDKDKDVKDPNNIISDAVSRLESLLQEGSTHLSNKATKSSHFAKPPLQGIDVLPENLIDRLLKATFEIKSVIKIIDEKIKSLTYLENVMAYLAPSNHTF